MEVGDFLFAGSAAILATAQEGFQSSQLASRAWSLAASDDLKILDTKSIKQ